MKMGIGKEGCILGLYIEFGLKRLRYTLYNLDMQKGCGKIC